MAETATTTNTSRRNLLLTAPAAAIAATHMLSPEALDPVWGLIRREKAVWDRIGGLSEQDDAAWETTDKEWEQRMSAVCAAKPTTAAGLIAMMDLFEERQHLFIEAPFEDQIKGIFAAARQLLAP